MRVTGLGSISVSLLAAWCVAASTSPLFAQARVSAAISGVVSDASGAVIAAATVTAKNLETAAVRTTATDAAGRYRLLELPVGAYEVTVAKDGFQRTVRGGIHLVVGQAAYLD